MKKSPLSRLSDTYLAALQAHFANGHQADLGVAKEIGREAVAIGLETLDLARIHHGALAQLPTTDGRTDSHESQATCAAAFFAEAITPIEQTHRGAREANAHLNQIVKTLSQRTLELANSVARLKQEILQSQVAEESLRASEMTSVKLFEKSKKMQEELLFLSRQLLSVQEDRRKLSRNLHDVIAQTLTTINVRLASLRVELISSNTELHLQITSTQRLIEKSVDLVHGFACELRPTLLDDLGLIPALQAFLKGFMEDTDIRSSLRVFAAIEDADGIIRTMLYRVVQEALNNVARHANASRVEVRIESLEGGILMEICDNGLGFDVNDITSASTHNRLGLLGMRERVEMLGGTFGVDSSPGQPTTVRVEIPKLPSRPL